MEKNGEIPNHILLSHEGGSTYSVASHLSAENLWVAYESEIHDNGDVILRTDVLEDFTIESFLSLVETALAQEPSSTLHPDLLVCYKNGQPEYIDGMRPIEAVDFTKTGIELQDMTIIRIAAGEAGDYVYEIKDKRIAVICTPAENIGHAAFGFLANYFGLPESKQDIGRSVLEQSK